MLFQRFLTCRGQPDIDSFIRSLPKMPSFWARGTTVRLDDMWGEVIPPSQMATLLSQHQILFLWNCLGLPLNLVTRGVFYHALLNGRQGYYEPLGRPGTAMVYSILQDIGDLDSVCSYLFRRLKAFDLDNDRRFTEAMQQREAKRAAFNQEDLGYNPARPGLGVQPRPQYAPTPLEQLAGPEAGADQPGEEEVAPQPGTSGGATAHPSGEEAQEAKEGEPGPSSDVARDTGGNVVFDFRPPSAKPPGAAPTLDLPVERANEIVVPEPLAQCLEYERGIVLPRLADVPFDVPPESPRQDAGPWDQPCPAFVQRGIIPPGGAVADHLGDIPSEEVETSCKEWRWRLLVIPATLARDGIIIRCASPPHNFARCVASLSGSTIPDPRPGHTGSIYQVQWERIQELAAKTPQPYTQTLAKRVGKCMRTIIRWRRASLSDSHKEAMTESFKRLSALDRLAGTASSPQQSQTTPEEDKAVSPVRARDSTTSKLAKQVVHTAAEKLKKKRRKKDKKERRASSARSLQGALEAAQSATSSEQQSETESAVAGLQASMQADQQGAAPSQSPSSSAPLEPAQTAPVPPEGEREPTPKVVPPQSPDPEARQEPSSVPTTPLDQTPPPEPRKDQAPPPLMSKGADVVDHHVPIDVDDEEEHSQGKVGTPRKSKRAKKDIASPTPVKDAEGELSGGEGEVTPPSKRQLVAKKRTDGAANRNSRPSSRAGSVCSTGSARASSTAGRSSRPSSPAGSVCSISSVRSDSRPPDRSFSPVGGASVTPSPSSPRRDPEREKLLHDSSDDEGSVGAGTGGGTADDSIVVDADECLGDVSESDSSSTAGDSAAAGRPKYHITDSSLVNLGAPPVIQMAEYDGLKADVSMADPEIFDAHQPVAVRKSEPWGKKPPKLMLEYLKKHPDYAPTAEDVCQLGVMSTDRLRVLEGVSVRLLWHFWTSSRVDRREAVVTVGQAVANWLRAKFSSSRCPRPWKKILGSSGICDGAAVLGLGQTSGRGPGRLGVSRINRLVDLSKDTAMAHLISRLAAARTRNLTEACLVDKPAYAFVCTTEAWRAWGESQFVKVPVVPKLKISSPAGALAVYLASNSHHSRSKSYSLDHVEGQCPTFFWPTKPDGTPVAKMVDPKSGTFLCPEPGCCFMVSKCESMFDHIISSHFPASMVFMCGQCMFFTATRFSSMRNHMSPCATNRPRGKWPPAGVTVVPEDSTTSWEFDAAEKKKPPVPPKKKPAASKGTASTSKPSKSRKTPSSSSRHKTSPEKPKPFRDGADGSPLLRFRIYKKMYPASDENVCLHCAFHGGKPDDPAIIRKVLGKRPPPDFGSDDDSSEDESEEEQPPVKRQRRDSGSPKAGPSAGNTA